MAGRIDHFACLACLVELLKLHVAQEGGRPDRDKWDRIWVIRAVLIRGVTLARSGYVGSRSDCGCGASSDDGERGAAKLKVDGLSQGLTTTDDGASANA
jgi:hypothetical protein